MDWQYNALDHWMLSLEHKHVQCEDPPPQQSGFCYRYMKLIITESFSGLSVNACWSPNQRGGHKGGIEGSRPWMTMRHTGPKIWGGNRTAISCNEIEVLLFFSTMSITPITAEVHRDALSSDGAPSACPARQTTHMLWLGPMTDPPCQIPFTSHWPQPPPHLAHR